MTLGCVVRHAVWGIAGGFGDFAHHEKWGSLFLCYSSVITTVFSLCSPFGPRTYNGHSVVRAQDTPL